MLEFLKVSLVLLKNDKIKADIYNPKEFISEDILEAKKELKRVFDTF